MRLLPVRFAAMALMAGSSAWVLAQEPVAETVPSVPPATSTNAPADSAQADFEVLNRGPVHEAFADQLPEDPAPTQVISAAPPEPINEVAPEIKPDDDAIWIPGYFAWSEADSDFLWVSGVWRVAPPGQRWTPGYWAEANGGWQWVPGFWADAQAQQLNYLPYPPESLDNGPTSPAPGDDHYWVNGCWLWQSNQYVWRPGYWNVYRTGWTWVPSYYCWSPRGAVFVRGYWDYPFARRGLLFAPIHYHSPIYRQPGYYYRPSYAIRPSNLLLHLFVSLGSRNMYYGDYYGSRYHNLGYRSWGNYHRHHSYLPSYVYYRHHFRHQGVDFADRLAGWHRYYDRHPDHRPAHTVADADRQHERLRDNQSLSRQTQFTSVISDLMDRDDNGRNSYRRIGDSDRERIERDRSELADLRQRREQFEDREQAPEAADRAGRVPADGDRTREGSRSSLELPNYLGDADRRERNDRQMRDLRSRIPETANEAQDRGDREPSRSFRDAFNNSGSVNRGDVDRGDARPEERDRANDANRGDLNRGDLNRGDVNRGDVNRGDINREDRQRPETPAVTPQTPAVTPPAAERPRVESGNYRDWSRNRGSSTDANRSPAPSVQPTPAQPAPSAQPRPAQPTVRPERPSNDASNRPAFRPSEGSPFNRGSTPSNTPPAAAPRREVTPQRSNPAPAPSSRSFRDFGNRSAPAPSARPSQPRVSAPERSSRPAVQAPSARPSQPRASAPERSSRPAVQAPSRSSRPPSASNRSESRGGGNSFRFNRGGSDK